jgi:molybdate transport system substrate-binding protein
MIGNGNALAAKEHIVVSSAASMTDLITGAAKDFTASTGIEIGLEFGSSGALARKVEAGAPIDIFVSANEKWIDYLDEKKLLTPGSKTIFARNTLVFCESVSAPSGITTPQGLANARLLSLGDPGHVPAGQYAQQSLEHFDLWNRLSGGNKLILATDVRAVLTHVQLGEVTGGIVYSTDAMASDKVRTVFTFPEDSHDPISYFSGILSATKAPGAAAKFMEYLRGEKFAAMLQKYGFTSP